MALASNFDAKIATEKAKTYSDASGKLALYFGVNPYAAAGVALTGYYATRKAPYACTKTKLFAEVISSSAGGTITIYVDVNGSMVSGPHSVVLGTPLDLLDWQSRRRTVPRCRSL